MNSLKMEGLVRLGIVLAGTFGVVFLSAVALAFVLLTISVDLPPLPEECRRRESWAEPLRRFYVNSSSVTASDTNPGTSPEAPLASLAGASRLALRPGDWVGLRAGSTYRGSLVITATGSEEHPIIVSRFGEGPPPRIEPEEPDAIRIEGGNWIVLEDLEVVGAFDSAVVLDAATRKVTVQRVTMRGVGRGVQVDGDGHRLIANEIRDLHMVQNTSGGDDDSGAQAFVITGQGHRFLCNRVRNARDRSFDYGIDGVGFEFWRSSSDIILRWNRVEASAGFLEIGGLEGDVMANLLVENNVAIDSAPFHWLHNQPGRGNFGLRIEELVLRQNTILERRSQGPIFGFLAVPEGRAYSLVENLIVAPLVLRMFSAEGVLRRDNHYVAPFWPAGPGDTAESLFFVFTRFWWLRRSLTGGAGEKAEVHNGKPDVDQHKGEHR